MKNSPKLNHVLARARKKISVNIKKNRTHWTIFPDPAKLKLIKNSI